MSICCLPFVWAADIHVKLSAPSQAMEGGQIRVSYTVNTQDVEDFKVGEFPGFEVLFGPSTSSQSSVSIINGRATSSSSLTFTYVLQAEKTGTFTLPAATIKSGGKSYKSNTMSIQVLASNRTGGGGSSNNSSSAGAGTPQTRVQQSGERITGKDIYITATANKRKVYEQEAILLTYKLYTMVSLDQITGEMPELDGFHTQELSSSKQMELKYERVNGQTYGTAIWRQYLLFPQKSGKLKIPSISFEADVVQRDVSMDPFDAFFNGGTNISHVKKTITTPALELEVLPLPTPKPDNFSGAVGHYTISTSLTPDEIESNEALTLRLIVSGKGNMKLMKAPAVSFPKDFETYDAKETDKTTIGAGGASGNVIFDYLAVPRHDGDFEIPAVEFCYFDPDAHQYRTLKGEAYNIHVKKGKNVEHASVSNQEDLRMLGSDIHYIKTSAVTIKPQGDGFFGSWLYWLSYVLIFLLFALIVIIFRRQMRERANVARQRGKKAGKEAAKRLKTAGKLMKSGDASAFYDEVMRALWGYVGDKLNLPVSELNKENISERLSARQVDATIVEQFLQVLGDCEFARFAPGDPGEKMDKLFASATDVINKLDGAIK